MKLQRILAKDSRSAHEQAIARFGGEVLVVSNSRVNGMTELIVAVEVEPEPTPKPGEFQGSGAQFESMLQEQLQAQVPTHEAMSTQPAMCPTATILADRLAQQQPSAQAMAAFEAQPILPVTAVLPPAPAPAVRPVAGVPVLSHYRLPDFLSPGRKPEASVEAAVASAPAPAGKAANRSAAASQADAGEQRARELVAIIREEIAHLRREFHLGQHLRATAVSGSAQAWIDRMADAGMSSGLRTLLMAGGLVGDSPDTIRQGIREQMLANLPPSRPRSFEPGIHLVRGPAGSGKTTMAARLASIAAQHFGAQRVALVSWRDGRPGAWAQIQLLATQTGVDVYRAADAATLSLLLADFEPTRVVFVDDGQSRPERPADLDCSRSMHLHLVMPADASALTLRQWCGDTAPVWQSLYISRLDHGVQPWPMLEIAAGRRLVIAGASRGAGLADLDAGFDAARLLDLALEPWGTDDQSSTRPEPGSAAKPAKSAKSAKTAKAVNPGADKVAGKKAGKVACKSSGNALARTLAKASGQGSLQRAGDPGGDDSTKGEAASKGVALAVTRRPRAHGARAEALHA